MKKRWLTSLCFCGFVIYASAQTTSGSFMAGGGIGFGSTTQQTSEGDNKTTEFRFGPSVGYFAIDKLSVGVNVDLRSSTLKNNFGTGTETKNSSISFGPFARYYMFTSNENFAFTGEVGFSVGSTKSKTGTFTAKGSNFNFYISPGFSYFFNKSWAIDLQLQGITYTAVDPNKNINNDKVKSLNFGIEFFNPSLGLRFFLGK